MPELPEVESLRRGLLGFVEGRKIKSIKILYEKVLSGKGNKRVVSKKKTAEFIEGLTGRKILDIQRRAKNLLFVFDGGALMLVHLKMTGQLVYKDDKKQLWGGHPIKVSESELPNKHTCVVFNLQKGKLFYNDVRKFGYLLYYPNLEEFEKDGHFDNLGDEPILSNFSLKGFSEKMGKIKGVLKKVFLEQKVVVGLGNIYVDEVCFMAGVRPDRLAQSLSKKEIEKLYEAIKLILFRAIELGGSSISDYLLVDGSRGNYAREHKVYGRGDEDCLCCCGKLSKIKLVGRTTVYCKKCQK